MWSSSTFGGEVKILIDALIDWIFQNPMAVAIFVIVVMAMLAIWYMYRKKACRRSIAEKKENVVHDI